MPLLRQTLSLQSDRQAMKIRAANIRFALLWFTIGVFGSLVLLVASKPYMHARPVIVQLAPGIP